MGLLDKFRGKKAQRVADDEKQAQAYEQDPTRWTDEKRTSSIDKRPRNSRGQYIGNWAPHPWILLVLRFLMYGLTSLTSLATAGVGIAVVHWYNTHEPVIKPSWGSLIACIVFGIGTPGVLYGLMIVTPFLFRPGTFLGILNQTRIELLMLFGVAIIWVSGALALAVDLRGTENCLWDGFFHYPKPDDFEDVCRLINVDVALAYTTFGLTCVQMVVVYAFALYTLLYLDQEVLTEQTNDMGGRAYRARQNALQQRRTIRNAQRSSVGTAGLSRSPSAAGGPMAGGVASSRRIPPPSIEGDRPMMDGGRDASDAERGNSSSRSRDRSSGSRAGRPDPADMDDENEGFYGYAQGSQVNSRAYGGVV
ncbi:hypothetical protein OIO90_004625 [Microbotryomycetes sp. JL221]|nr:hypothetical protein OIO90_004625 [Microbotryomycetes sp. JL221]